METLLEYLQISETEIIKNELTLLENKLRNKVTRSDVLSFEGNHNIDSMFMALVGRLEAARRGMDILERIKDWKSKSFHLQRIGSHLAKLSKAFDDVSKMVEENKGVTESMMAHYKSPKAKPSNLGAKANMSPSEKADDDNPFDGTVRKLAKKVKKVIKK